MLLKFEKSLCYSLSFVFWRKVTEERYLCKCENLSFAPFYFSNYGEAFENIQSEINNTNIRKFFGIMKSPLNPNKVYKIVLSFSFA